mgnify:CR=1 FL=1
MHVKIHTGACPDGTTTISNAALERVRGGFNPSRLEAVDRVKALTAALISEMEAVAGPGFALREAATAATQFQGACMFAVAALTAEA